MKVLVCNDDGINSEGIIALALMLSKHGHDVTVIAPSGNRSAFAHSMSFWKEMTVEKVFISDKFQSWSHSGTPADCAKFGLAMLGEGFDIVISGINRGSNLGTETMYSGTVGAALEAACLGYKAMAFSCTDYNNSEYEAIAEICVQLMERFYAKLKPSFVLNVNVPPIPSIVNANEVKITPLGVRLYNDYYKQVSDNVFYLGGEPKNNQNAEDCDVEWSQNGYITATPISCDRTNYKALELLKG